MVGALQQIPAPTPALRKGDRTRARLIAATVQVLGQVGYEAASVLEITKAAKVSNATFYLYFKNKEHVMDVAIFQVAGEITRRVHEEELHIPEIAQRAAYAVRRFISNTLENRSWARAMLAAYAARPDLRIYMSRYSLRTLREGIAEGAFDIEASPLEVECLNAVVMTAVRMQLEGSAGSEATEECIDIIIRMLGAEHLKAARPENGG